MYRGEGTCIMGYTIPWLWAKRFLLSAGSIRISQGSFTTLRGRDRRLGTVEFRESAHQDI